MATEQVEVPDGKVLFPYFVDAENEQLAVDTYASRMPIEYILDGSGNPTEVEKYTKAERAHIVISDMHNRQIVKYQRRIAAENATITDNVVS